MLDNYNQAKYRLNNLNSKLAKDLNLKENYHNTIEKMVVSQTIVEVDKDSNYCPVYYMPHRPVVKPSSLTTKIRPVFDASARGYNGVSLNDGLDTGPNLIPSLPGVLMRFCKWKYVITSDISKAFHIIALVVYQCRY